MSSLLSGVLGEGPAATIAGHVPDLHHYRGSFGGKDIIPLWRDAEATQPNVTTGLLELLAAGYGEEVTPEDLFAYAYALLATPRYTERFAEELSIPGPRIPLTRDAGLFRRAAALGKRLIWLHTYGERFVPDGERPGMVPQGSAQCSVGIPQSPEKYPEDFEYFEERRLLRVGEGEITGVAPEVWNFSISGLQVVKSWLDYRKKSGAGRHSSPLDDIRPERWTSQMTLELLDLLAVLEHTVAMFPELSALLDEAVQSECFSEDELPQPTESQRSRMSSLTLF